MVLKYSFESALYGIFIDKSKTAGNLSRSYGPRTDNQSQWPSFPATSRHTRSWKVCPFNLNRDYRYQEIVILFVSDKQTTIKSMSSYVITSKMVSEYLANLRKDLGKNSSHPLLDARNVGVVSNEIVGNLADSELRRLTVISGKI